MIFAPPRNDAPAHKRKDHPELLTDADSEMYGLVIWLETRDEDEAFKQGCDLVDAINAATQREEKS